MRIFFGRFALLSLLLCLLAFWNWPAHAKCANLRYTVSGVVRDCETGVALSEARVVCFADDEERAWSEGVTGPAVQSVDASGGYRGVYYLNAYSGPGVFVSDRCNRRLKRLTVVVSCPGYVSARVVVTHFTKLNENLESAVSIPEVTLTREGSACCPK